MWVSLAGELVGSELLGKQAFHAHVVASPVNLPPALVSSSPFLGILGILRIFMAFSTVVQPSLKLYDSLLIH